MELRDDQARFEQAGLAIVAIGQGSVARTKEFHTEMALPFPLLADPRRAAYTAYDLLNTDLRREMSISNLGKSLRAGIKYGGANSPDQDVRQLGGVFVVDQSGLIRFAHRSKVVSDHPSHAAMIAAIEQRRTE